jgi:hypothetical protein
MRIYTIVVLTLALVAGLGIAYLDSRPHWDDTGISAGLVFLASGFFSLILPRRAWLVMLLVGAWIPLMGLSSGNVGSVLALGFAIVGGLVGWGASRFFMAVTTPTPSSVLKSGTDAGPRS